MKLSYTLPILGAVALGAPTRGKDADTEATLSIHNLNNSSNLLPRAEFGTRDNFIDVYTFGRSVHVGQFHGQKMWDFINDAAAQSCEISRPYLTDYEEMTCSDKTTKYKGLEYTTTKSPVKVKTDSEFIVKVISHKFPDKMPAARIVRDALIDQVAHAFKTMTEQPGNCDNRFISTFGRKIKHCAVGQFVEARYKSGNHVGYLRVGIEESRDRDSKYYDCEHGGLNQRNKIREYSWSNVIPALKRGFSDVYIKDVRSRCSIMGPNGWD